MATDLHFYYGEGCRTAFHHFTNSADARGNGVEVVPAVAGATIYISGYSIGNDTQGALIFSGVNNAGLAGHDHITPDIHVPTVTTHTHRYHEPLSVGVDRNFGFVTSAAGQVGFEAWGFYAAPTENPASQSVSMSLSASRSASMSKSGSFGPSLSVLRSASQSKSRSMSGSKAESVSIFKSRSASIAHSLSPIKSASKSRSASLAESLSVFRSLSMSASASMSKSESLYASVSQSKSRSKAAGPPPS